MNVSVCLLTAILSASAPIELQMKGKVTSFDVEVSSKAHTLVELPMRCLYAVSSDEHKISTVLDQETKKFLYMRASGVTAGDTASVTVQCPGDVALHFIGRVTPSTKSSAVRVRAGELTQSVVDAMMEQQRKDLSDQVESEGTTLMLQRFLKYAKANTDDEQRSCRLVFVRAYRQFHIGNQGYLVFSVRNKSSEPFVVRRAEIQNSRGSISGVKWLMASPVVAQGATETGVAMGFSDADDFSRITLTVEGTDREIEVPNIDF